MNGPGVIFAPQAQMAIRQGVDLLANLVRPTLGPLPRCVAIAGSAADSPPELLDDAATILRRVLEVKNPYINMGAMLLRNAAWKVHQTVGDGTAITAVLFQTILRHGLRYVAAGGNPMDLRRGLEQGSAVAIKVLQSLARVPESPDELVRIAKVLCQDDELATMLGEIIDIVGSDGYVQLEERYVPGLERRYIEGTHWYSGYLSPFFVIDPQQSEVKLETPLILISDLNLTEAAELVPLLERMVSAGQRNLLVIAHEVSGSALALLVSNHRAGNMRLLAVQAPTYEPYRAAVLEDLAVMSGGRVISQASGDRIQQIGLTDLGSARQTWANAGAFGMIGGGGSPADLRQRIAHVKAQILLANDHNSRAKLGERLGKLMGGTAILSIGAATKPAMEARKSKAQQTMAVLKLVLAEGVVPGGGSAYLNCRAALQQTLADQEARVGLQILAQALEEPFRVIVHNAGYDPATALAQVGSNRAGWGFDVLSGQAVDMWSAGILDSVQVLCTALQSAVSGAVMALTTEVLVHKRAPMMVAEP